MQITINGEPQQIDGGMTVSHLVTTLGLDLRKVAIERNQAIVPRSRYDEESVEDGDAIEIVEFIGGG